MDPKLARGDRGFQIAVLMVAGALIVGPFVRRLVKLTGYSNALVRQVCRNMRKSRLWTDNVLTLEWFNEDHCYVECMLWVYTLVAEGKLLAARNRTGDWEYWAAPPR